MTKEIAEMININELYSHPKNPRKAIGDVEELTESIKKNGIMQNLTVIPGHYQDNGDYVDGGYTLLIGHRRFTAAKAAGLNEVPCRIVEGLDEKEQLGIMLEENMQRADLTIYEQAQGFQLMLDLGNTEEDIAKKTGFSKTTIKHRLEIAKLSKRILEKKNKDPFFQLSLMDLYELEKVKNIKTRNDILDNAHSSSDIRWRAKSAADDECADENFKEFVKACKAAGIKEAPEKTKLERYSGKWSEVLSVDLTKSVKIPKKVLESKEASEYVYYRGYGRTAVIVVRTKVEKKTETSEDKERKEFNKRKKEIEEIFKNLCERRNEFVKYIISGELKKAKDDIDVCNALFNIVTGFGSFYDFSTAKADVMGRDYWRLTDEEKEVFNEEYAEKNLTVKLLAVINTQMSRVNVVNYDLSYNKQNGKMQYDFFGILSLWGWNFKDDIEEAVISGQHEYYTKGKNDE